MKNYNAHLFEDPQSGILWLSEDAYDETGIVKTAKRELDLAEFKPIEAEYISYHHFGMSLSYDLVIVKNAKDMYSVLTPFHGTMGNGAIFASICRGFEFRSVYGFGVKNPNQPVTIYVLAETAKGKWGIIRIMVSNNIWRDYYDYNSSPFILPQEIIPFKYNSMEEALKISRIEISAASLLPHGENYPGYIRNLTVRNVDPSEKFGVTIKDMLKARRDNEEQVASSAMIHDNVEDKQQNQYAQAQEADDAAAPAATTTNGRAASKILRVTLADGTVIQEKKACDTFIKAIQAADAYRVRAEVEDLTLADRPLISDKQEAIYDHRHRSHPIPGTNLFVNTQSNNERKKEFLEKISNKLELGWTVELI